jgi:YggT family protein
MDFMLGSIFSFVVDAIAGLFAGFFLLRFWMQALRVRPPMQLAQAIYQLTDWLIHPLRRVIPGFAGYDWSSLIAALLVSLLSVLLEIWMLPTMNVASVIIFTFGKLAQWVIYGLLALLILEAIFSWVNPHAPFAPFVRALNAPILSPLRRLISPMGGIDFSPLIALLILQVLNMLLNHLMLRALSFVW